MRRRAGVGGELRINMPITYGKRVVMWALARLLLHSGLTDEVRLPDQLYAPLRDGMDAVIRIMPLWDSRLEE